MKWSAVICEFNPFHKGHEFLGREMNSLGYPKIALMSGNFVQRGEISPFPKEVRGKWAASGGFDMVLELPPQFSLGSAEDFAYGAVKILSQISGEVHLFFGSERGDMKLLEKFAHFTESENFMRNLKMSLKRGSTYPKALASALEKEGVPPLLPNDILAVEYLKAIKKLSASIVPHIVKRHGAGHNDESLTNEFSSGSAIRKGILQGKDVSSFCPPFVSLESDEVKMQMEKLAVLDPHLEKLVKLSILHNPSSMPSQLSSRFLRGHGEGFEDYLLNVKSKNTTLASVKRLAMKSILGISKEEVVSFKENVAFARLICGKRNFLSLEGLKVLKRREDILTLSKKQKTLLSQMERCDKSLEIILERKHKSPLFFD